MQWRKSPPALIEAFEAALPVDPQAQRRQMFGYPCAFVNGHMFAGLHQEHLIVRLEERARSELLGIPGAETFEPMPGRVMREYVVVPPRIVENGVALREWIDRAFAFALTLPIKGTRRSTRVPEARVTPPARTAIPARAAKKPATKKPTAKKPTVKKPTAKRPAVRGAATRKPAAGKAASKKAAGKKGGKSGK
ncbi:MAG: TfoX/Sxy family protein [Deltaproteobacteria bacterium]|nr:TfoX/Sxy family protein [Deltaproteobacteria bacterium]